MSETQYEVGQKNHSKQAFNGIIKGLVASIPYVGSPIVGAWDGYWGSRFEETVEYLTTAVIRLGEEKIDKQYIESEEYLDLFTLALRIRMQSRSREKAKFILGMLLESMQINWDNRFQTSDKESFLQLLDRLSEREMDFLYRFSVGEYIGKSKNDIYQTDEGLAKAMDGLLACGILREGDTWQKHLAESVLGREFIAYLKILAKTDT